MKKALIPILIALLMVTSCVSNKSVSVEDAVVIEEVVPEKVAYDNLTGSPAVESVTEIPVETSEVDSQIASAEPVEQIETVESVESVESAIDDNVVAVSLLETLPETLPETLSEITVAEESDNVSGSDENQPESATVDTPVADSSYSEDSSVVADIAESADITDAENPSVEESTVIPEETGSEYVLNEKETAADEIAAEEMMSQIVSPEKTAQVPFAAEKPSGMPPIVDDNNVEPGVSDKTLTAKEILDTLVSFVMKEKLLSFGLLVDLIGILYIFVALVKTSKKRDDYYIDASDDPDDEPDFYKHSKNKDSEQSDSQIEDDDFLKSLLKN